MSVKSYFMGQKAYNLHVKANRLLDDKQYEQADALIEQALSHYKAAMIAGCDTPRVLMSYSVLLMRRSEYQKAHDLMLKIEKLSLSKEEKRQLRLNFSVCQWKLGRLDAAIEQMNRVAEDGKNSTIYGTLGYMLIEQAQKTGDYSRASAFNAEAYDYDDEDASVLDNMGRLQMAQGDLDAARGYFLKAIERRPSQVDTLVALAELESDAGNQDMARTYAEKALCGRWQGLCVTTRKQAEAVLTALENRTQRELRPE